MSKKENGLFASRRLQSWPLLFEVLPLRNERVLYLQLLRTRLRDSKGLLITAIMAVPLWANLKFVQLCRRSTIVSPSLLQNPKNF